MSNRTRPNAPRRPRATHAPAPVPSRTAKRTQPRRSNDTRQDPAANADVTAITQLVNVTNATLRRFEIGALDPVAEMARVQRLVTGVAIGLMDGLTHALAHELVDLAATHLAIQIRTGTVCDSEENTVTREAVLALSGSVDYTLERLTGEDSNLDYADFSRQLTLVIADYAEAIASEAGLIDPYDLVNAAAFAVAATTHYPQVRTAI